MGNISKKEYADYYAPEKIRKEIRSIAICGYVSVGISLVLSFALGSFLGIFAMAVVLGCIIGMHMMRSKGLAIAWLVLSIIDVISTAAITGSIGGWLPLVASVLAVKTMSELDKSYDDFKAKQLYERQRKGR